MKCVCEEMIKRCGWAESLTFKCLVHGKITVDRRSVVHSAPVIPQPVYWGKTYLSDPLPDNYEITSQHNGAVGGTVPEPYFPMK